VNTPCEFHLDSSRRSWDRVLSW